MGENNWLPLIVRSRNQTDYHEGIYWKAPESYSVATSIFNHLCCCAKSLQSRQTLFEPMNCSLPGSSVHGILQSRILKWVAMPFSRGSSQPRDGTLVSCLPHRQAVFVFVFPSYPRFITTGLQARGENYYIDTSVLWIHLK